MTKEEIMMKHCSDNGLLSMHLGKSILAAMDEYTQQQVKNHAVLSPVSVSVLSDQEMREPIENALYSTNRFLTTQATDLAEGIIQYIKDAGYTIVRTER